MTNKEVQHMKKYLKSYRALQREVRMQRLQLSDLQRAIRLPGLHMDLDDPAKLQIRIERRQKKVHEAMAYAQERYGEIEALIDRTEGASEDNTWLYRQVLHLYYLDGLSLARIAELLHYTERHISRLHRKALEAAAEAYGKGEDAHGVE